MRGWVMPALVVAMAALVLACEDLGQVVQPEVRDYALTSTDRPLPGSKFLFSAVREGAVAYDIWVMRADGSGQTRLTYEPSVDHVARWSPNGKKMVFRSNRHDDSGNANCHLGSGLFDFTCNGEIYVMNADGSEQRRLTYDPRFDSTPSWSPNGKRIIFAGHGEGGRGIYVMDVDGSGLTKLTDVSLPGGWPGYSPDGRKIVFDSSLGGNLDIYVMNPDGSGVTPLTRHPASDRRPEWSPNGKQIVFNSDRDGNVEVYVIDADGTGLRNLTKNTAIDRHPTWSPNGREIAFWSDRDGNPGIYVMNADGTGEARLIPNTADAVIARWHRGAL